MQRAPHMRATLGVLAPRSMTGRWPFGGSHHCPEVMVSATRRPSHATAAAAALPSAARPQPSAVPGYAS